MIHSLELSQPVTICGLRHASFSYEVFAVPDIQSTGNILCFLFRFHAFHGGRLKSSGDVVGSPSGQKHVGARASWLVFVLWISTSNISVHYLASGTFPVLRAAASLQSPQWLLSESESPTLVPPCLL